MSHLKKYFEKVPEGKRDEGAIAFFASLDQIEKISPKISAHILKELQDQRSFLKLIASENYSSLAVQQTMGNLLTDKYSEGYVGHRFYAGCENVDVVEGMAVNEAKKIFKADHAYVQPHSGSDANLIAFFSVLVKKVQDREIEKIGKKRLDELTDAEYEKVREVFLKQRLMGLSLASGGHLTHGYRQNITSKIMRSFPYDVNPETGRIDYKELARQVKEIRPLILLAGYSAYPRKIDFVKMREIADSVGAVLVTDMAHFAGLVAGEVFQNEYDPIPYSHIVTSTTHKTLRGPRGGLLLCKKEFAETVDKGCPLVMGGPMPHVMAAKAIAFKEADTKQFHSYAHQVVYNAKALAESLMENGVHILTGGTDNHLVIMDVEKSFNLNGRQAEMALREAKMTVNRNMIPDDKNGPWYTSGIRLGTAALTTLGMKEKEMKKIAELIVLVLKETKKEGKAQVSIHQKIVKRVKSEVKELLHFFYLYPEIIF